ncbi:hypothetical protein [Chitinophaga defluvii]|uniref:Uncharacterized protein n=1 Tax=Chitinophaga defluvii TaxID=3163343 RepID=A0ABV2T8Y1_9BACT
MNIKRAVVYSKDVEILTGYKGRTARRLLQKIREKHGKKRGGFVTVAEFCEYTGFDANLLYEIMV